MHARVSFYDMPGGEATDPGAAFQSVTEQVQQMQGNRGGMLLVDHDGGEAMTITFWDRLEDLEASAAQANQLRQQAAESAALTIRRVAAYEVAVEFGR